MAKAKSNTKATIAPASIAGMASMASMGLTLVAPTPKATPVVVALRGGAAVASITLQGAVNYRVAAGHNAGWLASITAACKPTGVASVAALVQAQTNPVPTHFISYCLRKGYVKAAA